MRVAFVSPCRRHGVRVRDCAGRACRWRGGLCAGTVWPVQDSYRSSPWVEVRREHHGYPCRTPSTKHALLHRGPTCLPPLTRSACPRACHVSHRSSSGWQDSTVMEEDESSDGGLARVVACTRACLLDAAVAGARHSIADDRDDGTLEGDMEFTPVGGAGGRGASPATDQLVRRLSFSRAARQRHRQRTSTSTSTSTGTATGRRATQRAEAPRREGAGLCQACAGRGMPGCVRVTRVVWLALVQLCGLKFLRLLGRLPRATMRHAMQRLRQLRPRLCPSARRSLCSALVRPLACLSCCLPPVRMRALRAPSVLWGWGSMVTAAVCVHSVSRRPTAGHRTADAGDGVAHTPGS